MASCSPRATTVDESLLTGESHPLGKREGDEVLAGSLNLGAPVEMRVTRSGAATRHAAIVALMRDAMTQRPHSVASADRWAAPFLLGVIVLAALAAAAWSVIDPSRAVWVAVSVLIVTCPCALSLAAPSALLTASGHLARRGVLLRRPEALDAMARVQTLFLDKTGTLTDERPVLRGVECVADASRSERDALRRSAAALAAWSNHPLSRALATADATGAGAWVDVRRCRGPASRRRDVQGQEWRLGSAAFVGAASSDDGALQLWYRTRRPGLAALRFR